MYPTAQSFSLQSVGPLCASLNTWNLAYPGTYPQALFARSALPRPPTQMSSIPHHCFPMVFPPENKLSLLASPHLLTPAPPRPFLSSFALSPCS